MIHHYVAPGRHLEPPSPVPLVDDGPTGPPRGLHRRDVIRMAGAAGLLGLLATGCSPAFPGIRVIGQAWMAARPDEATVPALVALVPPGVDPTAKAGANLRVATGAIADDLTEGRVAWVQGWLLSETEGRIAALWALR